jgi:aspartokinase/homoserine dehydrogenase 1
MQVLKFGGSSVANAENINRVIEIIKQGNNRKAVIVSALGGITDLLLKCATLAEIADENYKTELNDF